MTKMAELATLLIDLTKDKKINWDIVDDNELTVFVGQNAIKMTYLRVMNRFEQVTLTVTNLEGFIVDSHTFDSNSTSLEDVLNLYRSARRSALKTDETLDGIMDALRQRK